MNPPDAMIVAAVAVVLLVVIVAAAILWRRSRTPKPAATDLWADERQREAERIARNRRPYDVDTIPPKLNDLTIVHYHYSYRDEEYAAVYLMPDHFQLPPLKTLAADLFAPYWNLHATAIWAWRSDNLTDHLTSASLLSAAKDRSKAMLDKLTDAGWTVSGRDAFSLNLWVIYLKR